MGDRGRLLWGALLATAVAASDIGTVIVFDVITNKVLAAGHLAGFWTLAAIWLAGVGEGGQRLVPRVRGPPLFIHKMSMIFRSCSYINQIRHI